LSKKYLSRVAVAAVTALAVLLFVLTPPSLDREGVAPPLPADLDAYLQASEAAEAALYPLIENTDKRIRWQTPGERSDYVVIYLHGFSATRQEIAPVPELLADMLQANLFETRLKGHGRSQGAMLDTAAEDWLDDAAEALAIGNLLGERIILMGTSTGATLALAMNGHPLMQRVESIILISPNMGPRDAASRWLTRPAGPLIARLMVGETRSWKAHNSEQQRYWSTSYPTAALVEVMRLVDRAKATIRLPFNATVLMLLSRYDAVISPAAAEAAFEVIAAPRKHLVHVTGVGDPSNHVLAGRILSPHTSSDTALLISEFVNAER
jgi:esterase/lipase